MADIEVYVEDASGRMRKLEGEELEAMLIKSGAPNLTTRTKPAAAAEGE